MFLFCIGSPSLFHGSKESFYQEFKTVVKPGVGTIYTQKGHVVSSAILMIELEVCLATQLWVNREYRRGLSTHPCGAPVLRISREVARQEVQDAVAQGRVQTQGLQLKDELGGYYGVEC